MKAVWLLFVFFSLFMLLGGCMVLYTLMGIMKARAIEKWPMVDATIQHSELVTSKDEGSESYEVVVRYDYAVDGIEYVNDKILPGYTASGFKGHRELFKRIDECSVVRARYNESDPSESYIVMGVFSSSLSLLFAGCLFFCFGLFFFLTFYFGVEGNSDYAGGLEIVR
ncbi:MAG: DUF3592 domain-containing protein [Pirellulaceae bacterium]